MQKITFIFISLLAFILSTGTQAQERYTLNGKIKDAANGEDLIGATLTIKELNNGVVSNEYGFYSITLPKGTYTVNVSYLGYATFEQSVDLNANQKLNIELSNESITLNEAVVTSEAANKNVSDAQVSVAQLDIKQIRKIPALLGEVDVVRSIQLLPGVSSVGEGSSGFNVRGGSIDQNLVLLDEAPVYNSSHLFGFFSVFNPDAVKDVKLIKGGIPAQYGGRLSSILDVRLKDGNNKKLAVNGGVGLIFSRLSIEAPIVKDKGSFIIAARRSYADVLAKPFLKGELKKSSFYFYDLTAKANYTLGKNDKIFLSGYFGRDVFGAGFGFDWGNGTASFRWNHVYNDKLFSNITAFYSKYDYKLGTKGTSTSGDGFVWRSSITNYSVKPDFTYYLNPMNTITFGAQAILYDFYPGLAVATSENVDTEISLPNKYALEAAVYLGDELKLTEDFTVQYGLRYSFFNYMGKGTAYTYGDATPGIKKPLLSEQQYSQWDIIKQYSNPEPRLSVKYGLNSASSIKASYNRTAQYIHLLSNTAASIPLDVWTPSTNNIKPQLADQYVLGYFRNFGSNNTFETSIEGYYKNLKNQVEYIDNADLILNPYLEGQLLNAKGRAYGLELYLKKNKGKLTGWVSYTLSRTERQTAGVNKGNWYPSRFDRTHNLNVVVSYDISERWSLATNFAFGSGTPISLAPNKIDYQGFSVSQNPDGSRNNYRIPAYYRFDLSATCYKKKKQGMKYDWNLVFSLYNVTGRRNAFAIYNTASDPDHTITAAGKPVQISNTPQTLKLSIFGSVIPGITYNFKF